MKTATTTTSASAEIASAAGGDEALRSARDRFFADMPTQFERARLAGHELVALQERRLRVVLRSAIERSEFHRSRMGGLDVETFRLDQLASLPVMTKTEMMASYDSVVTDPRLRLDVIDQHLATVGDDPVLLFDEYVALSSGGSSGVRGVFVNDLNGAAQQTAAVVRGGLAGMTKMLGWPPPGPAPMTIVAAPSCVHATRGLSSTFLPGRLADITYAPVTTAFDRLLEVVQSSQPMILIGYPSVIARLADARADGHLSIEPMVVTVTSEQLTPDQIERITTGLGVAPTNSYGTSEGLMGSAPPGSETFEFASDAAYVEFVDEDDLPVAVGERAHHVLVTNLCNQVQPLIRYRIDDTMTPAEPARQHGHQRATLEGRNDELLTLGGVIVHPATIRAALLRNASVADYQVRVGSDAATAAGQTTRPRVEVDVVPAADLVDLDAVAQALGGALAAAGVPRVDVVVRTVGAVARDPRTGKSRRFLPG